MVLGVLSFLALYGTVISHVRSTYDYHDAVAADLLLFGSIGILLIVLSPMHGGRQPIKNVMPWVCFGACLLLSALFAEDQTHALRRLTLYYSVFLVGVAFKVGFLKCGRAAVPFVFTALGLAHTAILSLVLMASLQANPDRPFDMTWVPYHSHIRHVAYHGMVAACAGVSLFLLGGRLRLLGYLIALSALTGCWYFGARGALLGWLIFIAVTLAISTKRLRSLVVCASLLAAAAVGAGLIGSHLNASPFTGGLTERSLNEGALFHTTGRTEVWRQALESVKTNPVLGFGPDGYFTSGCCMRHTVQPHNAAVQLLIEAGLLGLGSAVFLLFSAFLGPLKKLWRRRNDPAADRGAALLFACLAGFMGFSMVDGLFYHAVPLVLFAILVALFFASIRDTPD
jgi:O-antigen ligase